MAASWKSNYARYKKYFLDVYDVYNQKPDVKMFLEMILTIAIIAFFGALALKPTILTIIDLTEQIKQKEEVSAKMTKKIQDLNTAQNLVTGNSQAISLLGTAVPDTPLPDNFVRQVEGLSQKNAAQVLGMSSGDVFLLGSSQTRRQQRDLEPLPEEPGELSFTISLSGSFASLNSFLSDFEKMRRPARVDNAIINHAKEQEGEILVLTISGRVPFIKEQ